MQNRNYPHPVLSADSSDFKEGITFDLDISVESNGVEYKFNYVFTLNADNMLQMISESKSIFIIKVECPHTRFRKTVRLSKAEGSFTLPDGVLKNKVVMSSYVASAAKENMYFSNDFHDDYDDAVFSVYPGDILAEGPQFNLTLTENSDALKKTSSIFRMSLMNDGGKPDVIFDEKKIIIKLNKEDFETYKSLKIYQRQYPHLPALSSALFILPAMTMLIEGLKGELAPKTIDQDTYESFMDDKESEFHWFKVLRANLNKHNINLSDSTETSLVIAQTLLGNPLTVGLKSFDDIFKTDESGEEIS